MTLLLIDKYMEKQNSITRDFSKVKKTALLGILGALAIVLSTLETWFTPFFAFLPFGVKLGFSNIVTMYTADKIGFPAALYITALKVGFGFLTRGFTAGLMSLCGNLLSLVCLFILLRFKDKTFSFVGISIVCSIAHNLAQLSVACIISGTYSLMNYGKYLIIFALITGFITGTMLNILMPRINKLAITKY